MFLFGIQKTTISLDLLGGLNNMLGVNGHVIVFVLINLANIRIHSLLSARKTLRPYIDNFQKKLISTCQL